MNLKKILGSSTGKLILGSFIGQLIIILASPITTRLYSADELGVYTLLLTIVNMVGPVLCAKYEMAIVTEKEERKVYATIILCGIINLLLSTISIILYSIYIIHIQLVNYMYIYYIIIVYIVLLLNGLSNILIFYNNRNKDYDIISKVYVIRILIQNIILVVLGIFKCSIIGLLISQLISMLIGVKKQAKKIIPNLKELKTITKEEIIEVAKNNKNLAVYTAPANLINTASYSILNFFITVLYGTTVLGYYSLSYRMLGIPLTMVSRNVSKVFFEKASTQYKENKNFSGILLKITLSLLLVSVFMVAILEVCAPWAFKTFLGAEWEISGKYVQILVWLYGFRLIVSALTPALVVINRQDIELKLQCLFIISAIIIYILSKTYNLTMELFLLLITITYSIIYVIMYIIIFIKSRRKIKKENEQKIN